MTTQTIDPSHLNPWLEHSQGVGDAYLAAGPGTPPLGAGSLQLVIPAGLSSFHFAGFSTNTLNGSSAVALSDLTSLGYATYVTSDAGNDAPYLALKVDQ